MADSIQPVNWAWVALAAGGVVLVSASKALRWRWLYPPNALPVSGPAHFGILLIAQMLNLVVPVRLGEIARMGLMQQEGRPAGMTLGTIVVEKSLDLLAVGLLLAGALPMGLLPAWLTAQLGPGPLLTGGLLLAALLLAGLARHHLLAWLARITPPGGARRLRWHRYLIGALRALLDGIAGVEAPCLLPVLALTAFAWLVSALVVQAMLLAFGLTGMWRAAVMLMIALIFSNLLPTPPAMIGVVGAVTEAALAPFGVAAAQALALGSVLNLVLVGPPVLLGGWSAGLRLQRLFGLAGGVRFRQALGLAALDSSDSPPGR